MMQTTHSILLITIAAAVTFFLRAVPFLLFGGSRQMPPLIKKIADRLPPAIMAVLVVYCLKGDFSSFGAGTLASAFAILVVIGIHLWRRNTLLSVFFGTAIYMLFIRILG